MQYPDVYSKKIALFAGISREDLATMLECLGATVAAYRKGEIILMAGEMTHHVGILLSGTATIFSDDEMGNRSVLGTIGPADLFAETFVCAGILHSPVTVQAGSTASVLKISYNKILRTCQSSCPFHTLLIRNMLGILAQKNRMLAAKIDHISKKTIRQKLASFLLHTAAAGGSSKFSIGMDRQALSEYLCVNRSALSRELSKLKSDGLIDFSKNRFAIHSKQGLYDILTFSANDDTDPGERRESI